MNGGEMEEGTQVRLTAGTDIAGRQGRYVERFGDWHRVDVDDYGQVFIEDGEFELIWKQRTGATS
jgi:hypothetical protein